VSWRVKNGYFHPTFLTIVIGPNRVCFLARS
jgi:hypothetical protein